MRKKTIVGTIKYISNRVQQVADNNLKDHNITLAQVRVLRFLNESGGSCSQKQIEEFLQVAHPTVVGLVSRMEQGGYICSSVSKSDKRNKVVTVTDKGRGMSHELCMFMAKNEQKMLQGLTPEQCDTLFELLQAVASNLD